MRRELLKQARYRAKKHQIEFDITIEDIQVPEYCPILQIKLFKNKDQKHSHANSPSLDRIDPTRGYVKGNVQVISHKANTMKSSARIEDLTNFATWVLTYFNKLLLNRN